MVYTHEDFATHHFQHFKRRAPVVAALLKRPNWGYTAEELNETLGLETDDQTIEGTRRVLRDIDELLEICSRKKERGPPEKIYKPGKLLNSYRDPILHSVLGKCREEELDFRILCAIRCRDDPMDCSRPDCRICAANGIRTRWDHEKEQADVTATNDLV
jgi:hypothetical protein